MLFPPLRVYGLQLDKSNNIGVHISIHKLCASSPQKCDMYCFGSVWDFNWNWWYYRKLHTESLMSKLGQTIFVLGIRKCTLIVWRFCGTRYLPKRWLEIKINKYCQWVNWSDFPEWTTAAQVTHRIICAKLCAVKDAPRMSEQKALQVGCMQQPLQQQQTSKLVGQETVVASQCHISFVTALPRPLPQRDSIWISCKFKPLPPDTGTKFLL